jgi:hypothetical protein
MGRQVNGWDRDDMAAVTNINSLPNRRSSGSQVLANAERLRRLEGKVSKVCKSEKG